MKKQISVFILALMLVVIFSVTMASATPGGANFTDEGNDTATAGAAQSHAAVAGNVTELTISGYSTTQTWQGYFGNVSGTIQLADSGAHVMYNWSLANPEGEVYASNASSITWASIACFNMSTGAADNLTALEAFYNVSSGDVDGVDETFNLNDHAEFYVGSAHFASGECNNTKLYNSSGVGIWDEALLFDGSVPVFASLISNDGDGFDGATHDFEMLVLENGHSGDTSTTTYYFYVELE